MNLAFYAATILSVPILVSCTSESKIQGEAAMTEGSRWWPKYTIRLPAVPALNSGEYEFEFRNAPTEAMLVDVECPSCVSDQAEESIRRAGITISVRIRTDDNQILLEDTENLSASGALLKADDSTPHFRLLGISPWVEIKRSQTYKVYVKIDVANPSTDEVHLVPRLRGGGMRSL